MTKSAILGEELKSKRTALNLSLKEAENGTSIRMSYLKAIEDGEFSSIISPVYAEGFVKQYANFLQMDGERVVKDNRELFARDTDQVFDYGIGTLEVREKNTGGSNRMPLLIGGAVALIALIAGIFYFLNSGNPPV